MMTSKKEKLAGKQPKIKMKTNIKTTQQEDDLTGRCPRKKTSSNKDNFKKWQPNRKMTSEEGDLKDELTANQPN